MNVAGGGIDSGAATAAERGSRVGESHDEIIGGDQEGQEEKADYEDESGDGDEGDEEGEGEGGDKEGEGEGEGEREDGDEDGEDDDNDDDDYDDRVSSSEQDEDEDAWEDVAYESLARNLGRRRRRYLISRSSQVLRGNLQKLGGII